MLRRTLPPPVCGLSLNRLFHLAFISFFPFFVPCFLFSPFALPFLVPVGHPWGLLWRRRCRYGHRHRKYSSKQDRRGSNKALSPLVVAFGTQFGCCSTPAGWRHLLCCYVFACLSIKLRFGIRYGGDDGIGTTTLLLILCVGRNNAQVMDGAAKDLLLQQ